MRGTRKCMYAPTGPPPCTSCILSESTYLYDEVYYNIQYQYIYTFSKTAYLNVKALIIKK